MQFTSQPSEVDETQFDDSMIPMDFVMGLAFRKALKVSHSLNEGIVIGADTVVVINGKILGKPQSDSEAIEMLSLLSGKEHSVFTGLALLEVPSGRKLISYAETKVQFRSLEKVEIANYVSTGEPLDKAGAYGIQGRGAILVEKINGCYYNVVGLPVAKLINMLKEFGVFVG
jgi:septum formation protein